MIKSPKTIKKNVNKKQYSFIRKGKKFNNKVVMYKNIKFDSILEMNCYKVIHKQCVLKDLKLELQVPFELMPKCKYIADFVITCPISGKRLILDAKGIKTDIFKLKSKIMKNNNNPVVCIKKSLDSVKIIYDFFK